MAFRPSSQNVSTKCFYVVFFLVGVVVGGWGWGVSEESIVFLFIFTFDNQVFQEFVRERPLTGV